MINRHDAIKPKDVKGELILLRKALDTCVEGIVITDLEGNIIDLNKAILQLHGIVRKEDMIGKDALDFIVPEDRVNVATSMKKMAVKGYVENVVYCIVTVDGREIPVEANGALITDKQGNPRGSVVIVRDITERKQSEKALQESEGKYRDVVERANDGITIIQDGVIKYANKRSLELIGYTPDEMIGTPIAGYIHPDDLPKLMARYERRMAGEEVEPIYEAVLLHKDGRRVDAELNAGLIVYEGRPADLVIVRDITQRKKAEEGLRESEELFRALFENSSDAVAILNSDGTIRYESPSITRILGYSPEELIGKYVLDYIHPEDVPNVINSFDSTVTGDTEQAVSLVVRFLHKDGSWRTMEGTGTNLLNNPRMNGIIVNYRDITERIWVQEALRKSDELYHLITDNITDVIWITDMKLNFTYISPSVTRIRGYSVEEAISLSLQETLTPDSFELAMKVYEEEMAIERSERKDLNRSRYLQLEEYCKDGSTIWIDVEMSFIRDSDGQAIGIFGVARDITERKKAEEALQRSEEYHRSLLENAMEAVAVINRDGTLRSASPSAEFVIGRDSSELIGNSIFDYLHPDDLPNVVRTIKGMIRKPGTTLKAEVRILYDDGKYHTLEAVAKNLLNDPVVNGIVTNFRDITERKEAEEALRESEEQYSAVVQNVADAVFRFKEGQIIWANDRIEEILGYSKGELVGLDANLFLPEDVSLSDVYKEVGPVLERQGFFHGRTKATRKDGSVAEIEYSASLIPGKEPHELVGVARDITERKMAEEALQRSEEYYRSLLENAMEGIAVVNRDGTLRSASLSSEHMVGRDSQERMGTSIFEHMHPDDLSNMAGTFGELLHESGGTAQAEVRILHDDGTYRTLEVVAKNLLNDPVVDGIVANFRDITERKQAEEALLIKDNAIEKSLTAIAITDIQGTITYLNEACLRLWRIAKREDVVGQSFWSLLQLDADTANMVARSMIEHGQWQGELKFSRRNGERIDVEVLTAMVYDKHGKAIQTITSFVDITERKKMEQQLLLSGRLAAVGELAAGVAHELNNPLAAVQAFAQYLADRKDLDESVRSDVTTIFKESQRACKITGNLLSFARRHKPEKTMISINQVIEKCLELNAYRLSIGNIEVLPELSPELPRTMADFHQMEQVFINIINNAEQAMAEERGKGRLIIRTEAVGQRIKATFIDNGPGILNEDLESIFDPFFTTKGVGKGTGLGLSISYGIVQEHSGHLYAESKPGRGATFVVELPVVSADYAEEDVK